jgi:hypothetical protein
VIELAAAAAKSPSAWDEPGTLAFLIIFGMGVVLYFVFRSLAKHLRKINEAARLEAAQADVVQANAAQADVVQANAVQADTLKSPSGRGSLGQRPPG